MSIRQEFPRELQWMSHLKEWHVRSTRISHLPDFLFLFGQLTTLQLPKNALTELPPEIGPSAGMHGHSLMSGEACGCLKRGTDIQSTKQ